MNKDNFETLFSIVLPVKDMAEADLFFEKQKHKRILSDVEWILVDQGMEQEDTEHDINSPDLSTIKTKYQLHKIVLVRSEGKQLGTIYNELLTKIKGRFVCFSNVHIRYDEDVFQKVAEAIQKYPEERLFSTRFRLDNPDEERKDISSQKAVLMDFNQSKKILFFPHSYFVRTDLAKEGMFSDACIEEMETVFLYNLFVKRPVIVFVRGCYTNYDEIIRRRSKSYYGCDNKDFYIPSLKHNYIPLVERFVNNEEEVPVWLQKILFYELYFRFNANTNLRNHYLLNDSETDEFMSLASELLQYVPDELIMDNKVWRQYNPPFDLCNLLAYLKYDGNLQKLNRSFFFSDNKLMFKQCGINYNLDSHKDLKVKAFNIHKNYLEVYLRFFTYMLYEWNPEAIYATCNGQKYIGDKREEYSLRKVFGRSMGKSYCFRVRFPLAELKKENAKIQWYMQLEDTAVELPLFFDRAPSKINNVCPSSYWMLDDSWGLYYENNKLKFARWTTADLLNREKQYLKEMKQDIADTVEGQVKAFIYFNKLKSVRKAYFKNKQKHIQRRIWLYFDKLYKAGDNGEYAFRYAMSRSGDGIEHYYVINKDAPEYKMLKKEYPHNILIYNSFKCRLYALLAENIVATHPDIIEFFGYTKKQTSYMKNLFNPNLICIAHGVTIQKNADYQNRLFDNTMFYTTSSKYEVNHILQPIYGYEPDEVALTGMARFDGLVNRDQKIVLITPTWRRDIVGTAERNSARKYADEFKESNYYKIYNRLINDSRLIDTAKDTGYRIIFLLHPAMSAQIDDYDRNDYVELLQASGNMNYEKILTESSLMITDYSGIHYDFGYMRKPIIYYQPKEVPMRFEEGGMKFATMGFGPVCDNYEEAVRLICERLRDNCRMLPEYKKRADDFFAYDDHNNCERIYNAIAEWTDTRR